MSLSFFETKLSWEAMAMTIKPSRKSRIELKASGKEKE
jgi:hypothetical protein